MIEFGLSRRDVGVLVGIMTVFCFGISVDIWRDIQAGSPWTHWVIEGIIAIGFGGLTMVFLRQFFALRQRLLHTQTIVTHMQDQVDHWRGQATQSLMGLSRLMDDRFKTWGLTPSESEVARLLLQGLPTAAIAAQRVVTEKTIRTQTSAIYLKSGLGSRAAFVAYFLPLFFGD